jgi:hypothetical protein
LCRRFVHKMVKPQITYIPNLAFEVILLSRHSFLCNQGYMYYLSLINDKPHGSAIFFHEG